jgi:hypothetical protein
MTNCFCSMSYKGIYLLRTKYAAGVLIALMSEAARTSETSVNYHTTWRNNPEDSHLHTIALHTLTPCVFKINLMSSSICAKVFQVVSSLQLFRLNFCVYFSSPIRATCPSHLVRLDLISIIIWPQSFQKNTNGGVSASYPTRCT